MKLNANLNNAVLNKIINNKLDLISIDSPLFGLSIDDILSTKISFLTQFYSGMNDYEETTLIKELPEKIYNIFNFNDQPLSVIIALIKSELELIIHKLFFGDFVNNTRLYLYEEFELDNNGFNVDSNVEVLVIKLI